MMWESFVHRKSQSHHPSDSLGSGGLSPAVFQISSYGLLLLLIAHRVVLPSKCSPVKIIGITLEESQEIDQLLQLPFLCWEAGYAASELCPKVIGPAGSCRGSWNSFKKNLCKPRTPKREAKFLEVWWDKQVLWVRKPWTQDPIKHQNSGSNINTIHILPCPANTT